jgi:antitoxin ParD1/3/4
MPTRNVVLTERQAKFLENMVSSGRYQNASEVMREGLRLIEQQEAEKAAKLKALRDAVQLGIDDIEAGRAITFDTFEAMEDHLRKTTDAALNRKRK